jgi:hypothetical protein
MIVDKYGNYVRKFICQLWEWGRVDICMKFHMRAFDFFIISIHFDCDHNEKHSRRCLALCCIRFTLNICVV